MTVTFCSVQDVVDKSGIGANATLIASSAWVTKYINECEGVICGETQKNWLGEYSSVSSYGITELLKECCSSGAAKKVVAYDMSGYFSRQEAEIILDVQHDIFTTTLKTLKDLDTTSLRSVNA